MTSTTLSMARQTTHEHWSVATLRLKHYPHFPEVGGTFVLTQIHRCCSSCSCRQLRGPESRNPTGRFLRSATVVITQLSFSSARCYITAGTECASLMTACCKHAVVIAWPAYSNADQPIHRCGVRVKFPVAGGSWRRGRAHEAYGGLVFRHRYAWQRTMGWLLGSRCGVASTA